mmetsp:Transcript_6661/g.24934  ORF Transcript_6661/g.24934 Transcript_6661/m.24934 type:complete len:217 (-) Transcript_6661:416-1066(-)
MCALVFSQTKPQLHALDLAFAAHLINVHVMMIVQVWNANIRTALESCLIHLRPAQVMVHAQPLMNALVKMDMQVRIASSLYALVFCQTIRRHATRWDLALGQIIVSATRSLAEWNVNLLSALESSRTRAAVVAAVVLAALRTSVRAILNMVARVVSFCFAFPFFQTKVLSAVQEARAPPSTVVPVMRATEVRIVSIQFALVSWPTIPLFATKMDPV